MKTFLTITLTTFALGLAAITIWLGPAIKALMGFH